MAIGADSLYGWGMSTPETGNLEAILRQQESLRAIIESISGELELRPLLTSIVRHACDLLNADRGAIGLVDEDRELVRTEAVHRMPPSELGAEMPPGVGLAGRVLESQAPLILNQYQDLESITQPDLAQDAVIGVPIFWRGRMIGFFGIGAAPPRVFDEQDAELLTLLARHAAIAIENARLFAAEKRRARRQETLTRIGKLIAGSLDLDELLQTAVSALDDYLSYSNTAVFLVAENDPRSLILTARSGIYADKIEGEYHQPVDQGIVGAAARSRRPVFVPDVRRDPRYVPIPNAEEIQAELALPLIGGNRLLGVLNVETTEPLDADEVTDLEIVADQLGVAIANARLFDQTQHNLAETQLLYETSRRIAAAFDVDEVIEAYLQHVAVRSRYVCSIALYEFDETGRRTAVIVRGRWTPEDRLLLLQKRVPYTRDALDPPLDAGKTVTISDVYSDPRATEALRQIQKESGRPALAMIPLIVRRRRIGLVILSYPTVYEWSENDLWPYQVTAAQLATAINTRRQQLLLVQSSREVAVLRERQHLARELHDSVTQLIFSMTLIAQSIAPAWARDPVEGKKRVDRLLELSQNALAEMRALLFELRSGDAPAKAEEKERSSSGILQLQQDGLVGALENYLSTIITDDLTVQLDAAAYRPQALEGEITLFRIAQEALNNVVKHAQANRVTIRLTTDAEHVRLQVSDDGEGFEVRENGRSGNSPRQSGLGLHTMRERAENQGGRLDIQSNPGRGTTIDVRLPRSEGET